MIITVIEEEKCSSVQHVVGLEFNQMISSIFASMPGHMDTVTTVTAFRKEDTYCIQGYYATPHHATAAAAYLLAWCRCWNMPIEEGGG